MPPNTLLENFVSGDEPDYGIGAAAVRGVPRVYKGRIEGLTTTKGWVKLSDVWFAPMVLAQRGSLPATIPSETPNAVSRDRFATPQDVVTNIESQLQKLPDDAIFEWVPKDDPRVSKFFVGSWTPNQRYVIEELAERKAGCFIATAAYGSPLTAEVETLRRFRDERLLTNLPGQLFTDLYYTFSPPVAELVARSERLRAFVRSLLRPLVERFG